MKQCHLGASLRFHTRRLTSQHSLNRLPPSESQCPSPRTSAALCVVAAAAAAVVVVAAGVAEEAAQAVAAVVAAEAVAIQARHPVASAAEYQQVEAMPRDQVQQSRIAGAGPPRPEGGSVAGCSVASTDEAWLLVRRASASVNLACLGLQEGQRVSDGHCRFRTRRLEAAGQTDPSPGAS